MERIERGGYSGSDGAKISKEIKAGSGLGLW